MKLKKIKKCIQEDLLFRMQSNEVQLILPALVAVKAVYLVRKSNMDLKIQKESLAI